MGNDSLEHRFTRVAAIAENAGLLEGGDVRRMGNDAVELLSRDGLVEIAHRDLDVGAAIEERIEPREMG